MQEIERKFLLSQEPPGGLEPLRSARISQGYLVFDAEGIEVRLRRLDDEHCLSLKRKQGMEREEQTFHIPKERWDELWAWTKGRRLEKTRHYLPLGDLTAEIDLYHGCHEGLLVVEVEFPNRAAADSFKPPEWFGEDVTGNQKFSNRRLAVE